MTREWEWPLTLRAYKVGLRKWKRSSLYVFQFFYFIFLAILYVEVGQKVEFCCSCTLNVWCKGKRSKPLTLDQETGVARTLLTTLNVFSNFAEMSF